jgi:hypothetical protein
MYPLEEIYGPASYRSFVENGGFPDGLKDSRQSSCGVWNDEPLRARTYEELVEIVSFLSVMNKRHSLFFRGQGTHRDPVPAIFRPQWVSLGGCVHNIPPRPEILEKIWKHLNGRIASIVEDGCSTFPIPRRATLRMFREAVWAVAQHFELWPTPLVDVTPNLRVAASFALSGKRTEGHLYVVGLPPSTNSVTYDSDQHVVLARLQAVCPPIAKRPHCQDGFLVGRFPFDNPNPNRIDLKPGRVSSLQRRLLARIILHNSNEGSSVGNHVRFGTFWDSDFPPMSFFSLMPAAARDQLLAVFQKHADEIDEAMQNICKSG